jgi:transcription initiation factor TFIIH subunit 3
MNPDINRLVHPAQSLSSPEDSANLPDPRILILSVSPDASNSYIPVMNSIFSAQKLVSTTHVPPPRIPNLHPENHDRCVQDFRPDSVFLQQAAYLTGGSYIYLEHREALLQYLIVRSLPRLIPSQLTKRFLDVILAYALDSQNHHRSNGRQDGLRAACFCHKHVVDVGYVCSVCLSSSAHLTALPTYRG